jgi:peptide/nickel transport system substrate-binding protein
MRVVTGSTRRTTLVAIGVVALVLAGSGCGGGGSSSTGKAASNGGASALASHYTGWTPGGTPVRGGRVVMDVSEVPGTFDPYHGATASSEPYVTYDTLDELRRGPGTTPVIEPALASSWTISPDQKTWTFHIRPGVRFSNGEPLTGEDVVFSLEQMKLPTDTLQLWSKAWKKISLLDPMTVQLQLTKPEPALLELLHAYQAAIVPKKPYVKEGWKAFGLHPITTGPFAWKSATPGYTTVTLVRNPYYWRHGLPYLNEVVMNQVESDNARILAVRSGAATISQAVPYADVASLESTSGVKMLVGPLWGVSYVVFNRAKAPFNDANVRRALLYATPIAQIIKSVYKGIGGQSNSLFGRMKYWNPRVPYYPYDIAKAKEILKQSSVPNGFNVTINTSSGETQGELLASILQSAWAQIGVHVTIQALPNSTLESNFYSGKFEIAAMPTAEGEWGVDAPDVPGSFEIDNTEAGGFSPPGSTQLIAKFDKAIASTSEVEREKLFREIQYQSYWQEALFMPVTELVTLNLVSDKLHGFQVAPSSEIDLEHAWVQQ